MRWFVACLVLMATSADAGGICEDLWFTRNLLYHRAGNCFASTLGKAVFGNEGCTPGATRLDIEAKSVVAEVRAREAEWNCDVDTDQSSLDVAEPGLRAMMVDLPVASGSETVCGGWHGGRLPLRRERSEDGLLAGAARDGDTLRLAFGDVDGWSFVEVFQNDVAAGAGWTRVGIDATVCDMFTD